MVIVNGFPKTGCHALKKGVELLGAAPVDLIHEPAGTLASLDAPMVVSFRDPRNVLISRCRWDQRPLASGSLINLLRDCDGEPFVTGYRRYLPWLEDERVRCMPYEALTGSDAGLRLVALYLGIPYLEDAFVNLPGLTMTWTGKPSVWQDHWTEQLSKEWKLYGGDDLEHELGYAGDR